MARSPSFTPLCYAVIGLLVDNPNTVFKLTEQRLAERMEKYGWLTRRTIQLPQSAGAFHYEADFLNFVPTAEGLKLYNELYVLVGNFDLNKLTKAIKGERQKMMLKRKALKVN